MFNKVKIVFLLGFLLSTPMYSAPGDKAEVCGKSFMGLNTTLDVGLQRVGDDFHFQVVHPDGPGSNFLNWVGRLGRTPLGLKKLQQFYEASKKVEGERTPWGRMLKAMDIDVVVESGADVPHEGGLAGIPKEGPVVIVLNHPLFGIEGFALMDQLMKVRDDVKVIANKNFKVLDELDHVIPAQPVPEMYQSAQINKAAFLQSNRWVRDGHVVVVLPAGNMSYRPWREREVRDPPWSDSATRLAAKYNAPVVPVFVHGKGSEAWLRLRSIHEPTSHILDIREMVRQAGSQVRLTIGKPVAVDPQASRGEAASQETARLRELVYSLGKRSNTVELKGDGVSDSVRDAFGDPRPVDPRPPVAETSPESKVPNP